MGLLGAASGPPGRQSAGLGPILAEPGRIRAMERPVVRRGEYCPTDSGGVRAPGSRARGANSAGIHVFSRRARPAPGPRNPPFRAGAGGAGGGRARKGAR